MNITLRPYQQQGVDEIRAQFRAGARNVLYQLPTGGGKTITFSYITHHAAKRGNRVLILVHRQELLRQSSDQLNEIGVPHGMIAPGYAPDPLAPVQVASVQTLARRLDRVQEPSLIISDECHHSGARTWQTVFNHYSNSRILGVTATPVRLDGKGLGRSAGGYFDCMVQGPPVRDLISGGFLARPRVFCPPVGADLSGLKMEYGEYVTGQVVDAMDKPRITGCAVAHYTEYVQGAPAIAFCASVAHAEHVAEQFRAAGYSATSIDGKLPDKDRRDRITDLGAGRLNVLTSCDIISEGTDIPVVAAAILLRPTASLSLSLQQIGRALRLYPGKEYAVILDHVMNTYRHGLPDDDREWSLDGAVKKKGTKEKSVAGRQCHACYAFHAPAPACPYCGEVYPVTAREIEEVDGVLQEVSRLERQEAMRAKEFAAKDRRREEGRCQTLEDWQALAKQRGYSPGWGYYRWKARGGKIMNGNELLAMGDY